MRCGSSIRAIGAKSDGDGQRGTRTPESQTGASTTVIDQAFYPYTLNMQDTLRQVSGLQFSTSGQRGAGTSLFELGGNSNETDVLLDGIPINDIGGAVNFAYLASNGISQAEVYRGPDSALYGANASLGRGGADNGTRNNIEASAAVRHRCR